MRRAVTQASSTRSSASRRMTLAWVGGAGVPGLVGAAAAAVTSRSNSQLSARGSSSSPRHVVDDREELPVAIIDLGPVALIPHSVVTPSRSANSVCRIQHLSNPADISADLSAPEPFDEVVKRRSRRSLVTLGCRIVQPARARAADAIRYIPVGASGPVHSGAPGCHMRDRGGRTPHPDLGVRAPPARSRRRRGLQHLRPRLHRRRCSPRRSGHGQEREPDLGRGGHR